MQLLRHPIYALFCLASCGYVFWANASGYSPFFASRSTATRTPGTTGARFIHK